MYSLMPQEYGVVFDSINPDTSTLVDRESAPGESWLDTLQRVLPSLVTGWQQKQLFDVQIARAKAGQPPLDVSQYAPGVQVGVDSSVYRALIIGGAFALGLAYVLTRRRG